MSTPSLDGIHHLKIPVCDLARSVAWYELVLGARRQSQFDHHARSGEAYAAILDVPGLSFPVELCTAPHNARATAGFDPISFAIGDRADLQAWIAHLDRLGVDHSPQLRGVIGWLLVLRDPDGLAIRLYTREQHEFDEENADVASPWVRTSADAAIVGDLSSP
jgi:catechol 2,3-dioxygenase-like lactoylglutathione lyase family enzyme